MRVFVTGARGFIGRHLSEALASSGVDVVGLVRNGANGDVRNADSWLPVEQTDAIVHLAGLSDASLSGEQPVEYNTVNAVGTLVGLEAARRYGRLFVFASSQRAYRPRREPVAEEATLEPIDAYGYSKMVAERWVEMYHRVFGLRTVVLRFFSVFGPGQKTGKGTSGVVSIFTARALRGDDLVVHGTAWRDFTFVTDVVQGIRLALSSSGAAGRTYNIATGVGTSTLELAKAVMAATGSTSKIVFADPDRLGESYVADISKAQSELGYQPAVSLRAGLERYAESLHA